MQSFQPASNFVPKQTNMTKDNMLSQALNNRVTDDPVFFVYDHNMLKKEEDDLKEAILYFSPEYMSADDQCALCGQLMGLSEFLNSCIGQSAPAFFKFDHEKFALKRIGSYSFGLQASVSVPDSVVTEQLMSLYEVFVTFHGSVDSVRLRFKDSHAHFLKEFSNIWRVILKVSNVSLHSTLSQTFNNVPCIHLPQSGSHLFLQSSHLLQASQRRPFVLAGAMFYKNKVLCTQLSPVLTRHLTFLQNQIPFIARNTESDMPKGCKVITIFLTDDELKQITPVHTNANRHCKITNFYQSPKTKASSPDAKPGRKLTRRLTCSSVPSFSPDSQSKSPANVSMKNVKRNLTNEQFKSFYGKQNAMGIEQSTWGKNNFKAKVHLSHVPLVESRESPSGDERDHLGGSSRDLNVGQTYQQIEMEKHLDSFAFGNSEDLSDTETYHIVKNVKADVHSAPLADSLQVSVDIPSGEVDKENSAKGKTNENIQKSVTKSDSQNSDSEIAEPTQKSEGSELPCVQSKVDEEVISQTSMLHLSTECTDTELKKHECKNELGIEDKVGNSPESGICNDRSESINSADVTESDSSIIKMEANKSLEEPACNLYNIKGEITDIDNALNGAATRVKDKHSDNVGNGFIATEKDTGVKVEVQYIRKENANCLLDIKQDTKQEMQRLMSESEFETEDESEIVTEKFTPCIACLDLSSSTMDKSGSATQKCKHCQAMPAVKEVISKSGIRQEVIDFDNKVKGNDSDSDEMEAQSDVEGRHFYTAKSEALTDKAGMSSFSSDVSTDSTISRYWTYEMEGLNDVTLYVQCHSEISLLLIMENPEQYEENLFHSLWKGSLAHLADLDYYISECIENETDSDSDSNYKYARFDAFSSELHTNIEDIPIKKREMHLQQMLSVLHSDFRERHHLIDVTLRSQSACCYGHHMEGDETFFHPELPNRPISGLPIPRDPAFNLDTVAKQRLSEDKKMTVL